MEVYWLSFRISTERPCSQSTYQSRYDALMGELRNHSIELWSETTSFVIFSSKSTIGTLVNAFKAAIDIRCDHFIIRKMDNKNAIICGKVQDDTVFGMLSYLKRCAQ